MSAACDIILFFAVKLELLDIRVLYDYSTG